MRSLSGTTTHSGDCGVPSEEKVAAAYERWQSMCRSGSPLRAKAFRYYSDLRDARLDALSEEPSDG